VGRLAPPRIGVEAVRELVDAIGAVYVRGECLTCGGLLTPCVACQRLLDALSACGASAERLKDIAGPVESYNATRVNGST